MAHRALVVFVILLGIFCSRENFAQSAYDPNCYFPQMGNPNQLDTIYGGEANQMLGQNIGLLPPLKGQKYDRLAMQGLPDNIPFLTTVETGPSFDSHALNFIKKYPYLFLHWPSFVTGHFHTPTSTDILTFDNSGASFSDATIFWSDENGDYDTSRYTKIFQFLNTHLQTPYTGHFTSDTVDDIIMSINRITDIPPGQGDTSYIALLKGGQKLFDKGRIAPWDDTAYYAHTPWGPHLDTFLRFPFQGDWRGLGREDLLTVDNWGNFYYYKNDPPFDLHKFANSLKFDTLLVASEWSLYKAYYNGLGSGIPMQAFPKSSGDHSFDLLCPLPCSTSTTEGAYANGICIFRGGGKLWFKTIELQ